MQIFRKVIVLPPENFSPRRPPPSARAAHSLSSDWSVRFINRCWTFRSKVDCRGKLLLLIDFHCFYNPKTLPQSFHDFPGQRPESIIVKEIKFKFFILAMTRNFFRFNYEGNFCAKRLGESENFWSEMEIFASNSEHESLANSRSKALSTLFPKYR